MRDSTSRQLTQNDSQAKTSTSALDALRGHSRQHSGTFFNIFAHHTQRGSGLVGERLGHLFDGRVRYDVGLGQNIGYPGHVLHVLRGIAGLQTHCVQSVNQQLGGRSHVDKTGLSEVGDNRHTLKGSFRIKSSRSQEEVCISRISSRKTSRSSHCFSSSNHPLFHGARNVPHDGQ